MLAPNCVHAATLVLVESLDWCCTLHAVVQYSNAFIGRWGSLSPEAQELVVGLLEYNPNKRLTAQQVCPMIASSLGASLASNTWLHVAQHC